MKYINDEVYIIKEDTNVSFSKKELRDLGVYFFSNHNEIEKALSFFGINEFDVESRLSDYGLVLSHVGPLGDDNWALSSTNTPNEFIQDVWSKSNFYTVSLELSGKEKVIATNAWLGENDIEGNLANLIESIKQTNPDSFYDKKPSEMN